MGVGAAPAWLWAQNRLHRSAAQAASAEAQAQAQVAAQAAQAHDLQARLTEAERALRDQASQAAAEPAPAHPQPDPRIAAKLGLWAREATALPAALSQVDAACNKSLIDNETLRNTIVQVTQVYGQMDDQVKGVAPVFAEATNLGLRVVDELLALAQSTQQARQRSTAMGDDWQGANLMMGEWSGALAQMQEAVAAVQDAAAKAKLLSLNAAIVASQSGEHGRGFSVVAEQIKTLAQRTAAAAQGMAGWLGRIDGYKAHLGELFAHHHAVLADADGDHAQMQQRALQAQSTVKDLCALLAQHNAAPKDAAGDGKSAPMHKAVADLLDALLQGHTAVRQQTQTVRQAQAEADRLASQAKQLAYLSATP